MKKGMGGKVTYTPKQTPVAPVVPNAPAATPQPTPQPQQVNTQGGANLGAVLNNFLQMDDNTMASTLKSWATDSIDSNQQDTGVTRFFNAIGWAGRNPDVVPDEDALISYSIANKLKRQYMYHSDAPTTQTPDAGVFASQYMGQGRQFYSYGVYGDGTYWQVGNSANNFRSYGGSAMATQIKGIFNGNAKPINSRNLSQLESSFSRSHPAAYAQIRQYANASRSYGGSDSTAGIIAAIHGYNVIDAGNYQVVLDRSATTVVQTAHHGYFFMGSKSRGTKPQTWKYNT